MVPHELYYPDSGKPAKPMPKQVEKLLAHLVKLERRALGLSKPSCRAHTKKSKVRAAGKRARAARKRNR